MFKVIDNPTFTHDVPIMVPVDGGFDQQSIKTTFNVLSDEEFSSYDSLTAKGLTSLLKRLIMSFDDVVGDDDKPLHYNDKLRDQMLGLTYVRLGLLRGYNNAMLKSRAGN